MHLGLYSVHILATYYISDFKDMPFLKKKIDIFNQETKNNLSATAFKHRQHSTFM